MMRRNMLAMAAVAAIALAGLGLVWSVRGPVSTSSKPASVIGGPFTLTDHAGKPFSVADIKGTPFLIFFGFTYCPDICPTSLLDLTTTIKDLGPDADRMRYFFVSIDPERDTPAQLAKYLSSFDPRITGLTGTKEDVAKVAKMYKAYYERVPTSDGYTMNHSTISILMDRDGSFAGTIGYQETPERRVATLKKLIAGR